MGQIIALEPYFIAMVNEYDVTKASLKGSDQGFHNYLYYTDSLKRLEGIGEIVVFEQGKGIINNVGMFKRKPFRELDGLLDDKYQVLNWDGDLSPLVHQYDRDPELKNHVKKRFVLTTGNQRSKA